MYPHQHLPGPEHVNNWPDFLFTPNNGQYFNHNFSQCQFQQQAGQHQQGYANRLRRRMPQIQHYNGQYDRYDSTQHYQTRNGPAFDWYAPAPEGSRNLSIPRQFEFDQLQNCENIKLAPSPFYTNKKTMLKPTALVPHAKNRQTNYKTISLRKGSTEKVILRFCKFDISNVQNDFFPKNLAIGINKSNITVNQGKPKPGHLLDITSYVSNGSNHFEISWDIDPISNFCYSVYKAESLSIDTMLKQLKLTKLQCSSLTKKMIKEKFTSGNEIATTEINLSLLCPVSKSRIKIPVKSKFCTHLQCFDGETFLKMNEFKNSLQCIICYKPLSYSDIIVDEYFCDILEDRDTKDLKEVSCKKDGSWKQVSSTKDIVINLESSFVEDMASLIIVSDDDTDFETTEEQPSVICVDDSFN